MLMAHNNKRIGFRYTSTTNQILISSLKGESLNFRCKTALSKLTQVIV